MKATAEAYITRFNLVRDNYSDRFYIDYVNKSGTIRLLTLHDEAAYIDINFGNFWYSRDLRSGDRYFSSEDSGWLAITSDETNKLYLDKCVKPMLIKRAFNSLINGEK